MIIELHYYKFSQKIWHSSSTSVALHFNLVVLTYHMSFCVSTVPAVPRGCNVTLLYSQSPGRLSINVNWNTVPVSVITIFDNLYTLASSDSSFWLLAVSKMEGESLVNLITWSIARFGIWLGKDNIPIWCSRRLAESMEVLSESNWFKPLGCCLKGIYALIERVSFQRLVGYFSCAACS